MPVQSTPDLSHDITSYSATKTSTTSELSVSVTRHYGRDLRILSLDGGGTRGMVQLLILQRMFRTQKLRNVKPCDFFDLIVGTSTGGIVAVLLGRLQFTIDQAIVAYKTLVEKVYKPLTFARHLYDSTLLVEEVKRIIAEAGLDEDPEKATLGANFNRCHVALVARRRDFLDSSPRLFCSYDLNHSEYDAFTVPIWQAIRATSAMPYFFSCMDIDGVNYIDGGLHTNNPTVVAIRQAQKLFPGRDIRTVYSLGTGISQPTELKMHTLEHIFGCDIHPLVLSTRLAEDEASRICEDSSTYYFRFDPPFVGDLALERSGLAQLKSLTETYLDMSEQQNKLSWSTYVSLATRCDLTITRQDTWTSRKMTAVACGFCASLAVDKVALLTTVNDLTDLADNLALDIVGRPITSIQEPIESPQSDQPGSKSCRQTLQPVTLPSASVSRSTSVLTSQSRLPRPVSHRRNLQTEDLQDAATPSGCRSRIPRPPIRSPRGGREGGGHGGFPPAPSTARNTALSMGISEREESQHLPTLYRPSRHEPDVPESPSGSQPLPAGRSVIRLAQPPATESGAIGQDVHTIPLLRRTRLDLPPPLPSTPPGSSIDFPGSRRPRLYTSKVFPGLRSYPDDSPPQSPHARPRLLPDPRVILPPLAPLPSPDSAILFPDRRPRPNDLPSCLPPLPSNLETNPRYQSRRPTLGLPTDPDSGFHGIRRPRSPNLPSLEYPEPLRMGRRRSMHLPPLIFTSLGTSASIPDSVPQRGERPSPSLSRQSPYVLPKLDPRTGRLALSPSLHPEPSDSTLNRGLEQGHRNYRALDDPPSWSLLNSPLNYTTQPNPPSLLAHGHDSDTLDASTELYSANTSRYDRNRADEHEDWLTRSALEDDVPGPSPIKDASDVSPLSRFKTRHGLLPALANDEELENEGPLLPTESPDQPGRHPWAEEFHDWLPTIMPRTDTMQDFRSYIPRDSSRLGRDDDYEHLPSRRLPIPSDMSLGIRSRRLSTLFRTVMGEETAKPHGHGGLVGIDCRVTASLSLRSSLLVTDTYPTGFPSMEH